MKRFPILFSFLILPFVVAACNDVTLTSGGTQTSEDDSSQCDASGNCRVEFSYPLGNELSVELRGDFAADGWDVGIPMQIDGGQWRTSIAVPDGTTIRYKFVVDETTWVIDPNNSNTESDGMGGENSVMTSDCEGLCSTSSIASASSSTSETSVTTETFDWRRAVLYFVFVDRFRNGDTENDETIDNVESQANYQGGDFAGLLDAIEEGYFDDLGVNALWVTVPMDNPSVLGLGSDGHNYSAYHGYWPSDLYAVEEHFGDMDLLKEVVSTAHDHGIKIIFDYAMNHVHEDASVYAEHPDWFWSLDYNGEDCVCGEGCDWNDSYEQKRCWFRDYLPDWNFTNTDARTYSVDNAIWWAKETGADGYRLDAVKHIETNWISDLRSRVQTEVESVTGEHFYMVGETFEAGDRDIIKQYVDPTLLDGQFDFPLRGVLVETVLRRGGTMWDLDDFLSTNDTYYSSGIMSTFIGNHDLARVIHTAEDSPWETWDNGGTANWENPPELPEERSPFERLAVAFTFLYTTQGIPLVYYGDEIGMPGAGDPDNRRFMQWDSYTDDQEFLRDYLANLGQIRKENPVLWKGTRTTLSVTDDTYAYQMSDGTDTIYVAINRADTDGAVSNMPEAGHDLITDTDVTGPSIVLEPRSAMIIVAQ